MPRWLITPTASATMARAIGRCVAGLPQTGAATPAGARSGCTVAEDGDGVTTVMGLMLVMMIIAVCCLSWLGMFHRGALGDALDNGAVTIKQGTRDVAKIGHRFLAVPRR